MIRSVRERRNNRWWLVTVLAYAAILSYTGHTGLYISVAYTLAYNFGIHFGLNRGGNIGQQRAGATKLVLKYVQWVCMISSWCRNDR